MSQKTRVGVSILKYLAEVYPEAKTVSEICEALKLSPCSVRKWMRTLVASNDVKVVGKKERYNLYRYNVR